MDYTLLNKFRECKDDIIKLKNQNSNVKYSIRNCVKGEMLDEYLKSSELADLHVKKIEQELQELQRCLALLDG